ncbi:MAG: TetR/AcrR family transcriptional regulator [Saprospiraceae bacterium]|nr:TetR/AcrR family transcriptional regulator [Saprospiraceae bacterium]
MTAAFELFIKYGVKSVSMDDIADKLGISKKTIYAEIPSKEILIERVLTAHLRQDEEEVNQIILTSSNALDEILGISRHVLQFLMMINPVLIYDLKKYYPECWSLVENQHFTFIRDLIYNNVVRGINEKLYREDLDPMIIAKLYITLSNTMVNPEIFPVTQFDLLNILKQIQRYHLHGIVSDDGRKILSSISFDKS